MANPLYPIILEEMGQILMVPKTELESDLRDLARRWETCLGKVQINNRETAIFVMNTCVGCYLRGRTVGQNSYRLLKKNQGMGVALATLISLYVSRHSANYPRIQRFIPIGIDNIEAQCGQGDVLTQAEQILRERQGF